jgi:hypothetical protein
MHDLEDRIRLMLELFDLEETFERLDITPERVLEILYEGGHIELPPYLEPVEYEETDE